MIRLDLYETERPVVILERDEGHLGAWSRLQEAFVRGIVGGADNRLDVRADVVLSELEVLREVRRTYGVPLELGTRFKARLGALAADRERREHALTLEPLSREVLQEALKASGFTRSLRDFQFANLGRLAALPHGADFSVPGAGKTTVALASFAVARAEHGIRRMLVVAPLAAFTAWKEDAEACFEGSVSVSVHLGPGTDIPTTPDIFLTNYHRLASDYDRIRAWVARAPTQVVLDEAHRVKRGRDGVHGAAALDLAFSAERRDVLTGTPAPQGANDLVALMRFLYPGQARQLLPQQAFVPSFGREPHVLEATHRAVERYFVRTCKKDLDLPPTSSSIISKPMGPVQRAIYQALAGKYAGANSLPTNDRREMRDLGLVLMYLLEAATNPLLLTAGADDHDLPAFAHPPVQVRDDTRLLDLLHRYADYERPWKYDEVVKITRDAAAKGEKVLVWSSFVRNIRFLARELAEFNPAVVHGGIPPEDGAPPSAPTTREAELNRFRHDPSCTILLANPAACGEGVSLHHWCHHAVYLDRTFNAGHFLQSQDRIHRLGLAEGTETQFTFLISEGSIDHVVDQRLREKVVALSILMNDPGLVDVALPEEDDGPLAANAALETNDSDVLEAHLRTIPKATS